MFHLDSQVNVEKESKGQTFSFEPIGWVSSCFCEKFGTPRQSLYSKFSRGIVHLNNFINIDSFDGIQEFSHIWLVFVFHKSKHSKFKTKIKPPRLPGEKRGIFATRAPHRYNPIGLSLVKLEKVENREIWVSGIDLIDKTPILDIKPYHPVDSLSNFQCPEYINNPLFIYKVEFHPYSLARIQDIKSRFSLQFYQNDEDWEEVIREILAQDPSTVHTKTKHPV
jgi:tRNA-Thr(GGU) m(6)t(6)A37 methyltransferase TsaA